MSDEIELPEVDLGAVEAAVESFTIEPTRDEKGRFVPKYSEESGLPIDLDKEMDAAFDLIPDDLRAKAEMAPREKKPEQPKEANSKEPAPKAEAETPVKAEGTETPKNAEAEKAIAQLRLARFPEEVLANASPQQLIQWAKPIGEMHARTASEFQKRTEELKRAQDSVKETTETNGAPQAQPVSPDLERALQAFRDVDDSFTQPMANLVQAVRAQVLSEIQPALNGQQEIQSAYAELVNETIRREIGERFPDVVADATKMQEAEETARRLWGERGATYQDAAPTVLGRFRACWQDACKLVIVSAAPPRKDDSQRKAQGLSAPPARQTPKKALSLDEDLDASYEAVAKRWEKH